MYSITILVSVGESICPIVKQVNPSQCLWNERMNCRQLRKMQEEQIKNSLNLLKLLQGTGSMNDETSLSDQCATVTPTTLNEHNNEIYIYI